ncbi:MAG: deoxyribodipyrimidine photo-lyase, partial [Vicingaceae bacterium]
LKVLPLFIFDPEILDDLNNRSDARLQFIHQELEQINADLKSKGSRLFVFHDDVEKAFENLLQSYEIDAVYCNCDYEPYAIQRDEKVKELLEKNGVKLKSYKDQVIYEKDDILKADGSPYLVYTPYSKQWLKAVEKQEIKVYSSALRFENWVQSDWKSIISLEQMGFKKTDIEFSSRLLKEQTLNGYAEERNSPVKDSTSRLGIHLRFGTVSVRQIVKQAAKHSEVFLKELIWREFFMMILYHYPKVVDQNFNSKYDGLQWRNKEEEFERWCNGETGYLMVDAGMKELNKTGFMHNRVRMLVASFLCKHLLIDWRWGEAYFAEKLLDYELSSNNGNWQWAAGTGVDAAPYFRIFNPMTQLEKFDPNHIYVKRWLGEQYVSRSIEPMVDHKAARERALETYKSALK